MSDHTRRGQASLRRGGNAPSPRPSGGTLRLVMPEWQGGNEPAYILGARILELIAPEAKGPVDDKPAGS